MVVSVWVDHLIHASLVPSFLLFFLLPFFLLPFFNCSSLAHRVWTQGLYKLLKIWGTEMPFPGLEYLEKRYFWSRLWRVWEFHADGQQMFCRMEIFSLFFFSFFKVGGRKWWMMKGKSRINLKLFPDLVQCHILPAARVTILQITHAPFPFSISFWSGENKGCGFG